MAQGRSTKIISMIRWIRTSRLSIKNSLSVQITLAVRGNTEDRRLVSDSLIYLQARDCQVSQTAPTFPSSSEVDSLNGIIDFDDRLRVPRQQKMLKRHLPRVIYHQVY